MLIPPISRFQPVQRIAPSLMDLVLSGISLLTSSSLLNPNPEQASQAPYGALKENILGVISPNVMPQSGQA